MIRLYSTAMFLSAALLFSVQPMVGKMILPTLGGAASVWNTCMVFFQTLLLAGYAYAHWAPRRLGVRRQALLHMVLILLPFAILPIHFVGSQDVPPEASPYVWLLSRLLVRVGLPFFVLSTSAPLLQRWFASTGRAGSQDPYFLYAISNAGSLLALLGYPLLIEPNLGLHEQTYLWMTSYAGLVFIVCCCAVTVWRFGETPREELRASQEEAEEYGERTPGKAAVTPLTDVTNGLRLKWLLLAFAPSSLMLGVTTHITTDIASAPLLWVLPLAIYLLSFVFVFSRRPLISHRVMLQVMAYAVLLMPLLIIGELTIKPWLTIPIHLAVFFVISMVCHGELARRRPGTDHLTEFYLIMSFGGALGGAFNSLIAPQLFDTVLEYPLMIVAACFLRPYESADEQRRLPTGKECLWLAGAAIVAAGAVWLSETVEMQHHVRNLLVLGAPAVMCFALKDRPIPFGVGVTIVFLAVGYRSISESDALFAKRNFFGVNQVIRVETEAGNTLHMLINGHTVHGTQRVSPGPSREPLSYYTRSGPVGDVFNSVGQNGAVSSVAVVGLGAGALASYATPGQRFTFFEIDPAVREIATNPQLFTYLDECQGDWKVVLGDARTQIAKAPDQDFDLIILDAFSSDAIPAHLLTREALQLYLEKLTDEGILVCHISNRYLDLEPVLAILAEEEDLVCRSRADSNVSPAERDEGKHPSHYLVMAREEGHLGSLLQGQQWTEVEPDGHTAAWTDDRSSILSVLRW